MSVKLRLKRMGKKRQPIYKVVAADTRSPRDGKFIESIGLYNPKTDPATIDINEERAIYWLNVGAQPTDTVKNLLSKKGIILKRELEKQGLTEEQIEVKLAEWNKIHEAKLADFEKKKQEKLKQVKKKAEAKAETDVKTESGSETIEVSKEESSTEVKGAASEESADENKETSK